MGESLHLTDGLERIIQLIYRYGSSEVQLSKLISLTIRKVQSKIVQSIQSMRIDTLNRMLIYQNKFENKEYFLEKFEKELTIILDACSFSHLEVSMPGNEKIPYVTDRIDPGSLSILFEMSNNPTEKLFSGFVYTQNTEIKIMIILSLLSYLTTIKSLSLELALEMLLETTIQNNNEKMGRIFHLFSTQIPETRYQQIDSNYINMLLQWFLELKILEPSCGSGSFLVEMIRLAGIYYDNVVSLAAYLKINKQMMKKSDFLHRFISTCIYAVDINPLAVDIARFRVIMLYLVMSGQIEMTMKEDFVLPFLNIEEGDFLHTPFAFDINLLNSIAPDNKIVETLKSIMELRVKSQLFANQDLIRQQQDALLRILFEAESNLKKDVNNNRSPQDKRPIFIGTPELFSDKNASFSIYRNFCDILASGGFNLIIGNPPYVRQEKIVSKIQRTELSIMNYKKRLIHEIKLRYFSSFANNTQFEINMQSDYLVYFFYGSFPLLAPKGVHCFITSNSWLDVGYGMDFQEFIVKDMDIDLILDNSKARSFENAEINTVISIIRPKDTHEPNHTTKFMVLHQDYQSFLQTPSFKEIVPQLFLSLEQSRETEIFRIRSIEQKRLLELGMVHGKYEGLKWGNFLLRSPLIFNKLLYLDSNTSDLKAKLARFEDIFYVKGGIKSGANKFFLLEILEINHNSKDKTRNTKIITNLDSQRDVILKVKNGYDHIFEIEARFTRPLLETPKSIQYPKFELNKDLEKIRIFYCGKSKAELTGTLALAYIEWAESAIIKTERGKDRGKEVRGVHNLKTFDSKERWYSIDLPGFPIAIQKIYNTSFRFVISSEYNLIAFDNFHLLKIKEHWADFSDRILGIFLSSLRVFGINLFGRANFGGGALDIKVFELMQIPFLDPRFITAEEAEQMKPAIESILNRPILPYREEIKQKDLQILDRIVFSKLGFSESEITSFQKVLSDFIDNRLIKANKLKKIQD